MTEKECSLLILVYVKSPLELWEFSWEEPGCSDPVLQAPLVPEFIKYAEVKLHVFSEEKGRIMTLAMYCRMSVEPSAQGRKVP